MESTLTDDRFHDFDCDCPPEDKNFTHRMFYLQLPVALLIIVERGSDSTVPYCPVTVNRTLALYNMLPGQYHGNACVYHLASVLVHHGNTSRFGHNNCVIFNDLGDGLKFDDDNQFPVSQEKYINGKECKENCRMLLYINSVALQNERRITNLPWECEIMSHHFINVEKILFGLESPPNEVNLPTQLFRTIIGNEHLHRDAIAAFLQHLCCQKKR